MQTRRGFIQRVSMLFGALAVSGGTMFMSACGVVNNLLTAFQTILNILSAAGLVPGGALVTTALSAVISELQAYESAPAADKDSIGMDLSLAIQLAQARLQSWFSGLNLTGPLAVVIESLVSVILSTLAGLLPTLPVPPQSRYAAISSELKAVPHPVIYRPVGTIIINKKGLRRAYEQFRTSFNAVLVAYGYQKAF